MHFLVQIAEESTAIFPTLAKLKMCCSQKRGFQKKVNMTVPRSRKLGGNIERDVDQGWNEANAARGLLNL